MIPPEGHMSCPECSGWGSVERATFDEDSDAPSYEHLCDRCDGFGSIEILEVLAS